MGKIRAVGAAFGKAARSRVGIAGILAAGIAVGGIGFGSGAFAAGDCTNLHYPLCARSVASTQVVDNSLTGADVKTNSLGWTDLDPVVQGKVNDKTGQVTKVESDGPYPGSTKLQDFPGNGANSTEKVPADGKSHAVWVQCADGKTALGGGFRLGADQGDAVASKLQVTASEPTQIKDGKVVYTPIAGDAAGSLEPNGWLVEVINSGIVDATVRPWVTCAQVTK